MVTSPREMACRPDMHLISVDLPLPESPITTKDSPSPTWKETSRTPMVCPVDDRMSARLAPVSAVAIPRLWSPGPKTFHSARTSITM